MTDLDHKRRGDDSRIQRDRSDILAGREVLGIPRDRSVYCSSSGSIFYSQPEVKRNLEEALHESKYKEHRGWKIQCHTRILELIYWHQ